MAWRARGGLVFLLGQESSGLFLVIGFICVGFICVSSIVTGSPGHSLLHNQARGSRSSRRRGGVTLGNGAGQMSTVQEAPGTGFRGTQKKARDREESRGFS